MPNVRPAKQGKSRSSFDMCNYISVWQRIDWTRLKSRQISNLLETSNVYAAAHTAQRSARCVTLGAAGATIPDTLWSNSKRDGIGRMSGRYACFPQRVRPGRPATNALHQDIYEKSITSGVLSTNLDPRALGPRHLSTVACTGQSALHFLRATTRHEVD